MSEDRIRNEESAPGVPSALPSGLEVLSVTWMPSIRRYCLSIVGEPEDAQDVLQETFLEAQRSFARFTPDGDFGAWLRGIARNVAARRREKLRRTRRIHVSLEPQVLDRLEELVRQEETVDESPVNLLKHCLAKLSEGDRDLVRARYERGTDLETVCRELRRTLSWGKTRLMRLRWALADCVHRELKRAARTGDDSP